MPLIIWKYSNTIDDYSYYFDGCSMRGTFSDVLSEISSIIPETLSFEIKNKVLNIT